MKLSPLVNKTNSLSPNLTKTTLAALCCVLIGTGCSHKPSDQETKAQQSKELVRSQQQEPEQAASLAMQSKMIVAGAHADMSMPVPPPISVVDQNRDDFEEFTTNPIKRVAEHPVSTFSSDVDTASYSFVRRQLNQGYLPTKAAVRLEEMVNYFDYQYPVASSATEPFKATTVVHDSPWANGRKLVHIGVQGFSMQTQQQPDSNIVFLLDVSGSMNSADKLPLVKQSMQLLLSQLKPTDTVAIAVYAGAAGTVLPPTQVTNKRLILEAMNKLSAGGSTAGGEGLQLAYQLAEDNFKKDAVNRIILATDGDFNVGIADREQLQDYVERQRDKGIFLSVLGFGQGNYQDHLMQSLAQNGNGVAAYIDTLSEAQKVLVHEATSSLFPIATDLKFQVEFNPNVVKEYRLLGYETRALAREDFNNDKVDAGDIGSGHSVTAIYEVTLVDSDANFIDELRYSDTNADKANSERLGLNNEIGFLKLRYKLPGETESKLMSQPIAQLNTEIEDTLQQEVQFATAVAGFAQLLKDAKYTQKWNYDDVLAIALANRGQDAYGYRSEFVQLVRKAKMAKAAQF